MAKKAPQVKVGDKVKLKATKGAAIDATVLALAGEGRLNLGFQLKGSDAPVSRVNVEWGQEIGQWLKA